MNKLRQITVIGLGLLGSSIALAVSRNLSGLKSVGYSHRASTRQKGRKLKVADVVCSDLAQSVAAADIVILATPISTFENIFENISDALPSGCIVTDVGSTKVLPHRWASKKLRKDVYYVGSHPIAGSEQRGIEFGRDDLLAGAMCVLTKTKSTNRCAIETLRHFWSSLGCLIKEMTPAEHDRIFGNVSHLPHITAAALINACDDEQLKFAGRGFIDTSRIASGPENIWADILQTNSANSTRGIDRVVKELTKLKDAINSGDKKRIEKLLAKARNKRAKLINYKMKNKEILQ